MNCEICGRDITRGELTVKIEGSTMRTCRSCARLGERVQTRKPITRSRSSQQITRVQRKEKEIDVVDDCARLIRHNREKRGLTQDQLGAKINEKGSVISRIETGHMEPDIKMAKKLERFFDIKLLEEIE